MALLEVLNFVYSKFEPFFKTYFTKNQNSEPLKLPKMTFVDCLNSPKLDFTQNWSAQCWFFAPKLCIFWNLEKIQTASRSLNKVPFDRFFNGASEISKYFTHFWGIGPQFWILKWVFVSKLQNLENQLLLESFKVKSGYWIFPQKTSHTWPFQMAPITKLY